MFNFIKRVLKYLFSRSSIVTSGPALPADLSVVVGGPHDSDPQITEPDDLIVTPNVEVPKEKTVQVVLESLEGFSNRDAARLRFATKGLNLILPSEGFSKEVLSRTYLESQGLYPSQILAAILSGKQLRVGDKAGVLEFKAVMYYKRFSKVVGYTFPDELKIWMNSKFYGYPKDIASNVLHELTHQLGFTHTTQFDGTVPYQMNEIVEKLWPIYCGEIEKEFVLWDAQN